MTNLSLSQHLLLKFCTTSYNFLKNRAERNVGRSSFISSSFSSGTFSCTCAWVLMGGFRDGLDKPSPVLKLHSTPNQLQTAGWEGFSEYLCSVLKSVTWGEGDTKLLWKSFTRGQKVLVVKQLVGFEWCCFGCLFHAPHPSWVVQCSLCRAAILRTSLQTVPSSVLALVVCFILVFCCGGVFYLFDFFPPLPSTHVIYTFIWSCSPLESLYVISVFHSLLPQIGHITAVEPYWCLGSRSVISSVLQAVPLFICLSLLAAFCRRNVGLQAEFDFKSTKTFLKNCYWRNYSCVCAADYSFMCVADTPLWICPLKRLPEPESLQRLKFYLCFQRIRWHLRNRGRPQWARVFSPTWPTFQLTLPCVTKAKRAAYFESLCGERSL